MDKRWYLIVGIISSCIAMMMSASVYAAGVITDVSPSSGHIRGGDAVTITGSGITGVADKGKTLSVGSFHMCATTQAWQTHCWGDNSNGKLGDGTTTARQWPANIAEQGSLNGKVTKKIVAGANSTCALATDYSVHCWGYNANGQLGDGTTIGKSTPVEVTNSGSLNGKQVMDIAIGGYTRVCAITTDNELHCWGVNYGNQLNGAVTNDQHTPILVSNRGSLAGKQVQQVAIGTFHICAIANDDTVHCWGQNSQGQLGDGSNTDQSAPVDITASGSLNGKIISDIELGFQHTCATTIDGEVHCWGYNNSGQLGDGTVVNKNTPVSIAASGSLNGKFIQQISTHEGNHVCAFADDNTVHCWGDNGYGQLGTGNATSSNVPVDITGNFTLAGGSMLTRVIAGRSNTCALESNFNVNCWGSNSNGQLGNGTINSAYSPLGTPSGFYSTKTIASVNFGGEPVYGVVEDANTIRVITPSYIEPGKVDVTLNNPHTANSTITDGYEYLLPPAATALSPTSGVVTGGETVTLTGANFSSAPLVSVGGVAATNVRIVTPTSLTFTTPAHTAGVKDVVLTTNAGSATMANAYTYITRATVQFASASAASSDESAADNFPTLTVNGVLGADQTVQLAITGGTATINEDYTTAQRYPVTVTIPAGTYDNTTVTLPADAVPRLVQDNNKEADETIELSLTGSSDAELVIGSQSVHVYTITNDDGVDSDGDAILDAREDAGPNGGDGNYDGIPDSTQPHVAYFANTVTNTDMTLASTTNCTVSTSATVQSVDALPKDEKYTYPIGIIDYQLSCTNDGETATITLYLDKQYDTTNWKLRKYNTKTKTYSDVNTNVTYGTAGTTTKVTTIQYQVTDGGPLDEDGMKNGIIIDPVGPALPVPTPTPTTNTTATPAEPKQETLAETGASLAVISAISAALAVGGATVLRRR